MEKIFIGRVVAYFAKIGVAAIEIDSGEIKVGDSLYFNGYTTDFEQEIDSMQIDKKSVKTAQAGDSVGIKVKERVREGDEVFKISI